MGVFYYMAAISSMLSSDPSKISGSNVAISMTRDSTTAMRGSIISTNVSTTSSSAVSAAKVGVSINTSYSPMPSRHSPLPGTFIAINMPGSPVREEGENVLLNALPKARSIKSPTSPVFKKNSIEAMGLKEIPENAKKHPPQVFFKAAPQIILTNAQRFSKETLGINGESFNTTIDDLKVSFQSSRSRIDRIILGIFLAAIGISMAFGDYKDSNIFSALKVFGFAFFVFGFGSIISTGPSKLCDMKYSTPFKPEALQKVSRDILNYTGGIVYPTFPQESLSSNDGQFNKTPLAQEIEKTQPPAKTAPKVNAKETERPVGDVSKRLKERLTSYSQGEWPVVMSCWTKFTSKLFCKSRTHLGIEAAFNVLTGYQNRYEIKMLNYPMVITKFDQTARQLLRWEIPLELVESVRTRRLIRPDSEPKESAIFDAFVKDLGQESYNYIIGNYCSNISKSSIGTPLPFNKRIELIRNALDYLDSALVQYYEVDEKKNPFKDDMTLVEHLPSVVKYLTVNQKKYPKQWNAYQSHLVTPFRLNAFAQKVVEIFKDSVEDDKQKTRKTLMEFDEVGNRIELDLLNEIPDDAEGTLGQAREAVEVVKKINKVALKKVCQSSRRPVYTVYEYLGYSFDDIPEDPAADWLFKWYEARRKSKKSG